MPETDLIDQAIQALKAGEQKRAQELLTQRLAADPNDDRAWLLLSACLGDIQKKRYCLERALALRPDNAQARQALDQLSTSAAATQEQKDLADQPTAWMPMAASQPPEQAVPYSPSGSDDDRQPEAAAAPAGGDDDLKPEPVADPAGSNDDLQPDAMAAPAGSNHDRQPEAGAAPAGRSTSQAPTLEATPGPLPAKRSAFSRAQTCLMILLAAVMLAAIVTLAMIVFQGQGIGLPMLRLQAVQAPATEAGLTFFQFPATWTPAPTLPSSLPGPTVARTPTPGVFQTPLPSLTPISSERLIVIGRSVQNRPIEVYRFGSGEKERMIIAGIHGGDEGNTIALADQLIAHLRRNRRLVPVGYTLYILRSLNPDGETLGNVPEGRLNANGVDLNRNFDVGWKADWKSDGCSSLPGTGGSGPGSEPETQAIKEFLSARKVEVLINYHSAYLGIFPSGDPAHAESSRLAQAIHDISTYPYPPVRNGCEYTGTLVDWAANHGVLAAVDLELNSGVDTEFDTNLRVLSLLLSFEPQAPPSPLPPSPSAGTPSGVTQSPTASQTISVTLTVTPTLGITPTP